MPLPLLLPLLLPAAAPGAAVVGVGAGRMVPVSSMAVSAPVRRSSRSTSWPADRLGAGTVLALTAAERRQLAGGKGVGCRSNVRSSSFSYH